MGLTTHELTLRDGELVLRPMTEDDWDLVLRINNDPEIARFTEGGDWHGYTLGEVQRAYAGISAQAFMFVMELHGRPIGASPSVSLRSSLARRGRPLPGSADVLERPSRCLPDSQVRSVDYRLTKTDPRRRVLLAPPQPASSSNPRKTTSRRASGMWTTRGSRPHSWKPAPFRRARLG